VQKEEKQCRRRKQDDKIVRPCFIDREGKVIWDAPFRPLQNRFQHEKNLHSVTQLRRIDCFLERQPQGYAEQNALVQMEVFSKIFQRSEPRTRRMTKRRRRVVRSCRGKTRTAQIFFIHLLTLGIAGVEPNKKRPREKSTPELGTETLFKVVKVSEPQGSTSGPVLFIHWYRETEKKIE
jgi:hypothetical protein